MTGWFSRLFRCAEKPAPRPTIAERKADKALNVMNEAIADTRSLTEKLNSLYGSKGRDGFNAFMTDVALADQLHRHVQRAIDD